MVEYLFNWLKFIDIYKLRADTASARKQVTKCLLGAFLFQHTQKHTQSILLDISALIVGSISINLIG